MQVLTNPLLLPSPSIVDVPISTDTRLSQSALLNAYWDRRPKRTGCLSQFCVTGVGHEDEVKSTEEFRILLNRTNDEVDVCSVVVEMCDALLQASRSVSGPTIHSMGMALSRCPALPSAIALSQLAATGRPPLNGSRRPLASEVFCFWVTPNNGHRGLLGPGAWAGIRLTREKTFHFREFL